MTQVQTAEWLTTQAMAERLGIHKQTLLEIRRKSATFKRTRDWRNTGLSTRGPLQWHAVNAEKSFTNARRVPPSEVETFEEVGVGK